MRSICFVCRVAIPVSVLLCVGIFSAGAEPIDARQACTPDAMRLCSEFIPDEAAITKCMFAKRAQLSPDCHTVMVGSSPSRSRRAHHRRHS